MLYSSKIYQLIGKHGILLLVLSLVGGLYWLTLAPGVTWANNGSDSGDLITAAVTLGVAHPTGYPTYLLLAHLFQTIPIGDLAFRTNLFSATAALLTVGSVYFIVYTLTGLSDWKMRLSAGMAALSLGISPLFWSQAVIAEVYTLNTLFTAILWYVIIRAIHHTPVRSWIDDFGGIIVGLALGNHVTISFTAAIWFVTITRQAVLEQRSWLVIRQVIAVGVGLLVYLYLPLRAAAHPGVIWGSPSEWSGFWWVVAAEPYEHLAFGLSQSQVIARIGTWPTLLWQQFGWIGIILACIGICSRGIISRHLRWLMMVGIVLHSGFALAYDTADFYAYLLPVYLLFAIWIGVGVATLVRVVETQQPILAWNMAIPLVVAAMVWPIPVTAQQVDASNDRRAIAYAIGVLDKLPEGAMIVTTSDMDTFPLWYYHFALGRRPDIMIITEPLLQFPWYRQHIRLLYPDLHLPSTDVWTVDMLQQSDRLSFPICRVYPKQEMTTVCRKRATDIGKGRAVEAIAHRTARRVTRVTSRMQYAD